jgi:hypothetical protein
MTGMKVNLTRKNYSGWDDPALIFNDGYRKEQSADAGRRPGIR